jgi:hypothetical protein
VTSVERWPGRPYGCTCPEQTWTGPPLDWAACRDRAGFDTHPVLTADDIRAILDLHAPPR